MATVPGPKPAGLPGGGGRKRVGKVRTDNSPSVRQSGGFGGFSQQRATPEQFGAASARATQGVGQALDRTGQEVQLAMAKIKARQDLTDFNQAKLDYDTEVNEVLFGDGTREKPGVYARKGKNFLDQSNVAQQQIDEISERTISNENLSDNVRERLRISTGQTNNGITARLSQRAAREREVYDAELMSARQQTLIENSVGNLSSDNPVESIVTNLTAGKLLIQEQGQVAGKSPEAIKSQQDAFASTFHIAHLQSFEEDLDVESAKEYLSVYREDLSPTLRDEAQNIVRGIERKKAAEAGKLLASLRSEVRDTLKVLDSGAVPPNLIELQGRVKGTVLEQPVREALEDKNTVSSFATLPLSQQVTTLRELNDKPEKTVRDLRLQQRLTKVANSIRTRIRKGEGLVAASSIGVIKPPTPIRQFSVAELQSRSNTVDVVSDHFSGVTDPTDTTTPRVPINILTPDEEVSLVEKWEEGSADSAVQMVQNLRTGLGDKADAVAAQVSKDAPRLAMALARSDSPAVVREIVKGARLLKDNKDVLPSKSDRVASIDNVFGGDNGVFTPDTAGELDTIVESANAIYAARKVGSGDLAFDEEAYEQALKDAVGGVVEFNDRKIISPVPGTTKDQLEDSMDKLTNADLVKYGNGAPVFGDGKPFVAEQFDDRLFGTLDDAQLVTSGFGTYLVFMPGSGYIMNDKGTPYEIDLKRYLTEGSAGGERGTEFPKVEVPLPKAAPAKKAPKPVSKPAVPKSAPRAERAPKARSKPAVPNEEKPPAFDSSPFDNVGGA